MVGAEIRRDNLRKWGRKDRERGRRRRRRKRGNKVFAWTERKKKKIEI